MGQGPVLCGLRASANQRRSWAGNFLSLDLFLDRLSTGSCKDQEFPLLHVFLDTTNRIRVPPGAPMNTSLAAEWATTYSLIIFSAGTKTLATVWRGI